MIRAVPAIFTPPSGAAAPDDDEVRDVVVVAPVVDVEELDEMRGCDPAPVPAAALNDEAVDVDPVEAAAALDRAAPDDTSEDDAPTLVDDGPTFGPPGGALGDAEHAATAIAGPRTKEGRGRKIMANRRCSALRRRLTSEGILSRALLRRQDCRQSVKSPGSTASAKAR
jgi:hypothetical protein